MAKSGKESMQMHAILTAVGFGKSLPVFPKQQFTGGGVWREYRNARQIKPCSQVLIFYHDARGIVKYFFSVYNEGHER